MDQRSLVVCAIFRDAARALPEWIAYHCAIGFDRFVLYDNASSDGGADLLRRFALADRVTVIQWPQQQGQLSAYRHFIDIFAPAYDWAAFIDVDEFILPLGGHSLQDTLARCAQASAILLNARVFGPAGHEDPAPGLVIEAYDRRVDDALPVNRHVKSIVRCTDLLDVTQDPRTFRLKGAACNPLGQEVPNAGLQQAACFEGLAINHYYTKSRAEWLARVERESAAASPADAAGLFDQLAAACQVQDVTIKTYASRVRALLGLDAAALVSPDAASAAATAGAAAFPDASAAAAAPPVAVPPAAASPAAASPAAASPVAASPVAASPAAASPAAVSPAAAAPAAASAAAASPAAAAPVAAPSAAGEPPPDVARVPMILTPGVLPETVSGGTAPAAPFAATPAAFAEPGTGVASTSDQARGLPVLAPPAREQPGWSARGADAFEYSSGLALVFRDRSRSAEPWLAALRGDAAGLIDPDFLLDDVGRLRDFPDAQAARSACEAELMNDQNG